MSVWQQTIVVDSDQAYKLIHIASLFDGVACVFPGDWMQFPYVEVERAEDMEMVIGLLREDGFRILSIGGKSVKE